MIAALIVLALAGQAGGASGLAAFEQSLLGDPENLRVAADYRQLAIGAGDFDRPIEFLEKLSKRAGAGPNVFLSLALAYVDKVPTSGDIRRLYLGRDAMNAATKSIERKPTPFAYYMRGQINLYYNTVIFKRIPRGIEDLKKALELTDARTPSVVLSRIYAALGDGYWRLDDRTRAREVWKEGVARIPGDTALARRLEGDAETVRWVVIDALSASTRVDTSLRGVVPSP